jgi:hypothetical protein
VVVEGLDEYSQEFDNFLEDVAMKWQIQEIKNRRLATRLDASLLPGRGRPLELFANVVGTKGYHGLYIIDSGENATIWAWVKLTFKKIEKIQTVTVEVIRNFSDDGIDDVTVKEIVEEEAIKLYWQLRAIQEFQEEGSLPSSPFFKQLYEEGNK